MPISMFNNEGREIFSHCFSTEEGFECFVGDQSKIHELKEAEGRPARLWRGDTGEPVVFLGRIEDQRFRIQVLSDIQVLDLIQLA